MRDFDVKELQDFLQKNNVEFLTEPAEEQGQAAEEEDGEGKKEGAKKGRIISLRRTYHPAVTGPASPLPCRGG